MEVNRKEMNKICVICNKQLNPKCTWSACSLANKLHVAKPTSTLDNAKRSPEYDGKFYPQWKQEIDQFTGRH
jgi:hypothetical protein